MAVAHYLEALDWQREFIKIHAILGGKNPHLRASWSAAWRRRSIPTARRRSTRARSPQLKQLDRRRRATSSHASTCPTCSRSPRSTRTGRATARGVGNYLVVRRVSRGRRRASRRCSCRAGIIRGRDLSQGRAVRSRPRSPSTSRTPGTSTERATTSALHPFQGETQPNYTGPEAAVRAARHRPRSTRWLKSPRYDDEPMEVGPLARMLVAYVSGHARVKELVGAVLKKLERRAGGAVLDARPRRGARHRDAGARREDGRRGSTRWRRTWAPASCRIHDNSKWEPAHLAGGRDGRRLPRGAARRARPLGADPERARSRTTSASCRAPGMPARATRKAAAAVRRGAGRNAGRRSRAAARDPADRALLRSVHGLRRARRRRRAARDRRA